MARQFRTLTLGFLAVVGLFIPMSGAIISGHDDAQTPAASADPFSNLHFRSIGPAQASGRVSDVAVYEANPAIFYVGSAHGGVWKTTNNGATFTPQLQNEGLIGIGDIAVSQKNPDLVWVGTGEANNRQSTGWGGGVYKSTDGGKTYKNMGLTGSHHINRIVIDADNDNVVLVAAAGPLFRGGGERGIYKTTDGGATWKQVLKGADDYTGANDLVQAAADHKIMYASTYQRQRSECCMSGGGPNSGIWKSTDAGDTWTRLTGNGLPAGNYGRIGLDVFRRSANLIYAEIQTDSSGPGRGGRGAAPAATPAVITEGIYRSDDGGATWKRTAANPDGRAMYFSQIRVDPNNPDRVLVASVRLSLSIDGGRSFTPIDQQVHDDKHAIWWDPNNSDHIIIGSDGGVYQSWDMTRSWIWMPNLPIATFYHVGYDNEYPYNVCGGMQDNYNWCGPSAVRTAGGISNDRWHTIQGGDGFVAIPDQNDPRIVYTESQDGNLTRKNRATGQSKSIRPTPANTTDNNGGGQYRFHWDTPLQFSASGSGALLAGGNKLFRSTDRGDSWTAISPDLTSNGDREEKMVMGIHNSDVRIAKNDGVQSWPAITSVADSAKAPNLLVTGTDDGTVSISRDNGKTWDKKAADRMPGFVKGGFVSKIVLSRFDPNVIYVTSDAHRSGNTETHIWVSKDQGATFTSLNGNLSAEAVKTITEDTKNPDVLYIGTETGLFLSLNRGQSWQRLAGGNFPTVRTDEIVIHHRDNALLVATHGRGIFILDHLSPVQEFTAAQSGTADAKLFTPGPALQWRQFDDKNDEFWAHQYWLGENPPTDAVLNVYFKKALTDVKLRITDAAGRQMRELTVPAAKLQPGIQTVCWDHRVDPLPSAAGNAAAQFPNAGRGRAGGGGGFVTTPGPTPGYMAQNPCGGTFANRGGGGGGGGATAGPMVVPGNYNVALVVDGKVVDTKPLKIVADPIDRMSDLERKRYFDMAMDLHDMQRRSTAMTSALQSLYSQMNDAKAKIDAASPDVKAAAAAFQKDFDAVCMKFGVPPPPLPQGGGRGAAPPINPANVAGRVGQAKNAVLAFAEIPSATTTKAYADMKLALPKAIAEGNAVIAKANALTATLKKVDVTLTVPAPIK